MNIFGIGPLELLFIFLIALILLGPSDMVQTSRRIGAMMRRFFMSDTWKSMKKIRDLPTKLMRESGIDDLDLGLDDIEKEIDMRKIDEEIKGSLPDAKELTVDLDAPVPGKSVPKKDVNLSPWVTSPSDTSDLLEGGPEVEEQDDEGVATGTVQNTASD